MSARMAAKKKPLKKKAPAKKAAPKKVSAKKPAAKKKVAAKRPVRKAKRPALKPKRKKVERAPKKPAPAARPNPEALLIAQTISKVALDKKAGDVVIIDTSLRGSAVGYDYVVLATGESDRQLAAISEGVDELLKPQGKRAASVEASLDWVCVNYDEGVVAHFFTSDKRELVDLEGLWSDAPRVPLH